MTDEGASDEPATKSSHPNAAALPEKLLYLCIAAQIDRAEFIADVCNDQLIASLIKGQKGVDRRTARGWLNENPKFLIPVNRDKIVAYWRFKLGIEFPTLWFSLDLRKFKDAVDTALKARSVSGPKISPADSSTLIMPLMDRMEVLPDTEIKYISGKYKLYRFSLSGEKLVVMEFITIAPVEASNTQLAVKLFSHPTQRADDEEDGALSEDIEEFTGALFKFGRMYYVVTSFTDGNLDLRMRYLQFPVVETMKRRVHYGLVTGYSARLQEPAAVRGIARKISSDTQLTPEERRQVHRIAPKHRDFRSVIDLLANDPKVVPGRKGGTGQWLMTTDQRRISPTQDFR